MAVKFLIIAFICFRVTNSQYYAQPPSPYQPSYFPPQQYATPFPPPNQYPPPFSQFPHPPSEAHLPTPNQYPVPISPTFAASPYNPGNCLTPNFASYPSVSNYPPFSQTYSAYANQQTYPTLLDYQGKSKSVPKLQHKTAVYYLAQELPKAAKAVKENILETPDYNCPFCNGFADVPKSPKIVPPPSSTSVLPGLLEKLPTITKPDVSKLEDLKDLCKKPLAELLEHKLSGKLRFDEDVLDGFLTGLGFGKNKKVC